MRKIRKIAVFLLCVCLFTAVFGRSETKAAPSGTGTYKVTTSAGLNVRSHADTGSSKITAIKVGTVVEVTQVNGDWGYVPKYGGWINLNYADLISSSESNSLTSANISNGYYIIKLKSDSSKGFDVEGAEKENGVRLHVWEIHGGDNQVFYLERQNDGTYKITAKHSNLSVEVRNSSHENEADVAQWDYADGYDCKLWYVIDCGSGYYKFVNKESKKCIDIQGNGVENGTRIWQYEDNGTDAQRFQLVPVNGTSNTQTGIVHANGGLRVRKGRGTNYAKLTTIPNGTTIEISDIQSNWGKVTYAGHTGYISMDFVQFNNAAENTATNTSGIQLDVADMKQYDSRWKNVTLGKSGKTMKSIGCAVTSLAMAESYRTKSTITPNEMAGKLSFTSSGALYWPSNYKKYSGSEYLTKLSNLLSEGKPVLICGFTNSGGQHWVIVKGYNGNGLSASNFTINDPNSSSRTTLQDFLNKYSNYSCLRYYD